MTVLKFPCFYSNCYIWLHTPHKQEKDNDFCSTCFMEEFSPPPTLSLLYAMDYLTGSSGNNSTAFPEKVIH